MIWSLKPYSYNEEKLNQKFQDLKQTATGGKKSPFNGSVLRSFFFFFLSARSGCSSFFPGMRFRGSEVVAVDLLTSSREPGGQAEAYLTKQPELHHTSHHKNHHDSTATCRENDRGAMGKKRHLNREVDIHSVLGGRRRQKENHWSLDERVILEEHWRAFIQNHILLLYSWLL